MAPTGPNSRSDSRKAFPFLPILFVHLIRFLASQLLPIFVSSIFGQGKLEYGGGKMAVVWICVAPFFFDQSFPLHNCSCHVSTKKAKTGRRETGIFPIVSVCGPLPFPSLYWGRAITSGSGGLSGLISRSKSTWKGRGEEEKRERWCMAALATLYPLTYPPPPQGSHSSTGDTTNK